MNPTLKQPKPHSLADTTPAPLTMPSSEEQIVDFAQRLTAQVAPCIEPLRIIESIQQLRDRLVAEDVPELQAHRIAATCITQQFPVSGIWIDVDATTSQCIWLMVHGVVLSLPLSELIRAMSIGNYNAAVR